jgi:hypothetical protein
MCKDRLGGFLLFCALLIFYPKIGCAATNINQVSYRWRNDNGSQTAATWIVAQDKKIGLRKGTAKRLRFLVKNTGDNPGYGAVSLELKWRQTSTCSSGAYDYVLPEEDCGWSPSSCYWSTVASSYYADFDATTNVASGLTDPGGLTFVAGSIHDNRPYSADIALNTNKFTEVEFNIAPTSNTTTNGDYCLRLDEYYGESMTYTQYAQVKVLSPTAVDLIDFAARGSSEAVRVSWQTGQESDNRGFDVLRSESENGPYVKLNAAMIPSASVSGEGQSYEFSDPAAAQGAIYCYKLSDVDVYGAATEHGPVCVDWDGDGMPDDWEIEVGLDPEADDGELDSDGDGTANLLEYLRGTDPLASDIDSGSGGGRAGSGGGAGCFVSTARSELLPGLLKLLAAMALIACLIRIGRRSRRQ